jgi:hypothetical protein
MRMVRFRVTGAFIAQALAMPEGTTLYNIVPHESSPNEFVFYVEHPDLPELAEGAMPPEIMPTLKADYDRRPATWIKFDWGLSKHE